MTDQPTVFVVDDDPAARESVCALIEAMGLPTASYRSGEEFLEHYNPNQPGCVVTDLQMPGLHGVQVQQQLAELGARIPVIVISGYANVPITVRAMQLGAVTLLEKPYSDEELTQAVQKALAMDAEMRRESIQFEDVRRRLESLTEEERKILDLLIAGTPNKVIAKQFDLGLRTVERRRQRVFAKMAVQSVADLARKVTEVRQLA